MDYKCFQCPKEFSTEKSIISHLKYKHSCKDNTDPIKCVINYQQQNACSHSFFTFHGLRKHLTTCLQKRNSTPCFGDVFAGTESETEPRNSSSTVEINNLPESFDENVIVHEQVYIDHTI